MEKESFVFFVNVYIKMLVLLSPFFSVSIFLIYSEGLTPEKRTKAAYKTSLAILATAMFIFFLGTSFFQVVGITIAAFQIGAGSVLFMTSIRMILGIRYKGDMDTEDDFAVVPVALPIIVGPGTIGAILVWSNQAKGFEERSIVALGILAGCLTMMVFILFSHKIQRLLGNKVLDILMKVSALILISLASQIIFTGIKEFLLTPSAN